ncbi:MAG: hypothetical protein ACE5IK_02145 [Acidobacteriota bacterium]
MSDLKYIPRVGRWLLAGLAGAATLLWPAPGVATLLAPLDLDALAGRADAVVHARVVSTQVTWNDAGTLPVTIVELSVLEVLDGSVGARTRLQVTTPGGTVGGIALDYPGRPRFIPGEETVVFVKQGRGRQFIPVGLVQGTFQVGPAGAGGQQPLSRRLNGAQLIGAGKRPLPDDLEGMRQALRGRPRTVSGGGP